MKKLFFLFVLLGFVYVGCDHPKDIQVQDVGVVTEIVYFNALFGKNTCIKTSENFSFEFSGLIFGVKRGDSLKVQITTTTGAFGEKVSYYTIIEK